MYSKDGRKLSAATVKRIVAVVLSIVVIVATLAGCVPAATNGEGTGGRRNREYRYGPDGTMIIYILVIVAVFYFLMIRPEKKKRKKAEDMRNSLSVATQLLRLAAWWGRSSM